MRIPSYDDLTPSIPDVLPGEAIASVSRLLPASRPATSAATETASTPTNGGLAPSVLPPATELYACLCSARGPDRIVEIARDFSPRIERHAGEAVVLDVSGLGRLLGSPAAIGTELARMAAAPAPSDIRVAVAPTQVSAMLLSLAGRPLTVVVANAAAALSPLPLRVLKQLIARVHGATVLRKQSPVASRQSPVNGRQSPVASQQSRGIWPGWPASEQAFEVLQRWGVQTLGALAALPGADLSARMGQEGVALQRLARGVDPRPLVPDPAVPRLLARMALEWPIDGLEPLSFVLARLLDPLSTTLERADRAAAAIRLDLRLVDRTVHGRVLQLPTALRDPKVLRTLLLLDLESHPPSAAIDVVTVEIDPAPGRVIQFSLLARALPSTETLATLTARLAALVGEARCGTPDVLDTHRPDGFAMRPAFARSNQTRSGEILPQPLAPSAFRRFRPPVAVRVGVDRGRPAQVAIDRRGMPGGRVVQASGPWRSSGAWWEPGTLHWDRDEWDVELGDGSICRLFRENDTWFLEGVVD